MYDYFAKSPKNEKMLIALWEAMIEPMMKILTERMTTEAMALYILDILGVRKRAYSLTEVPACK